MKGYLLLLLFALLATTEGKNTVSGTIEKDTKWVHSNLSVRPAMTASIWYQVKYPTSWTSVPIIKFYYNGQNSTDFHDKCVSGLSGQLFNKDLAIPLDQSYGTDFKTRVVLSKNYRDKFYCSESCTRKGFWIFSTNKCEYRNCYGKTEIQDFEPKSYSFSIGFGCGVTKASLREMLYDVIIDKESNKTHCVDLKSVKKERMGRSCDLNYRYAAIPNQLGDTELDGAITRMNGFVAGRLGVGVGFFWKMFMNIPKRSCLKKLEPVQCEIFLPKCSPEKNKIHLPCRDTCKSILEECADMDMINNVNCNYLPPCSNYRYMLIIWISIGVVACLALVTIVIICFVKDRKKTRVLSRQSNGNHNDQDQRLVKLNEQSRGQDEATLKWIPLQHHCHQVARDDRKKY